MSVLHCAFVVVTSADSDKDRKLFMNRGMKVKPATWAGDNSLSVMSFMKVVIKGTGVYNSALM